MEELEKHLRALCSGDPRLRLLEAQWEYDKRLVQQALQTIGSSYPHYSLHDASHSNSILLNISRVLGERIARLTATDTWLLLEAAYWHDVGMVVNDATLRQVWSSAEFREHLQALQRSDDGVLAHSANLVLNRAGIGELGNDWPIAVKQALTFVVADYFRRQHQVRSAEIVRHPAGSSIDSPRTLIPSRLFEWLARVCLGHGQAIQDVMCLPRLENGIGTDRCHPRFVAFMLRLGDLLDLDNGRFCPVLLSSIGSIPSSSRDHIGKHAAVEHFYVGPDRIEVEAICKPGSHPGADIEAYGSYQAISQWLGWLRSELTHLAINWTNIAPADVLGAPSIGSITAKLAGFELVGDRSGPEFDVDADYFLELSKSSGLFGAPQEAWQRELITNAVDATLVQIWNTASAEVRGELTNGTDPFMGVRRVAADHTIEIDIVPAQCISADGKQRQWSVSIKDRGCGLGADDIRALQVVGSSSRNRKKRLLKAEMPQELRPTGSFGLGFQSVFLDTSEVEIDTVHAESGEHRRIVLRRPDKSDLQNPDNRSGVYIQRLTARKRGDIGTTIRFSVSRLAQFGIDAEDVILNDNLEPTAAKWIEQLALVCGTLPVPIVVNGTLLAGYHEVIGKFSYFDRENAILISLGGPDEQGNYVTRTAYRGAQVTHQSGDGLLSQSVDLYAGVASEMLQVSRSALTTRGEQEFNARRDVALPKAVDAYVNELRNRSTQGDDLLPRASLFALSLGLPSCGEEWRDLSCLAALPNIGVPQTLRAMFELQEATLLVPDRRHFPRRGRRDAPIPAPAFMIAAAVEEHVKKAIATQFCHIDLVDILGPVPLGMGSAVLEVYRLCKERKPIARVSDDALEQIVVPRYPGRPHLFCADRYSALAVNAQHSHWSGLPSMLSPFRAHGDFFDVVLQVRLDHPQSYIGYVMKHRASPCKLADIVDAAKKFVRYADSVYRKSPELRCDYDVGSACDLFDQVALELAGS